MSLVYFISTILGVFLYKSPLLAITDTVPKGTYIVSANLINNKGKLTQLITGDSIFIFKHWAAEVRIRAEFIEMNGIQQRPKYEPIGFYLINFKQRSFAESKNLKDFQDLKYKSLSEKKNGFDFGGEKEFFHNETYKVEKCLYNGKKARRISYNIQGGTYNHNKIIIYVSDTLNTGRSVALYPQMEKQFKGSIMELNINLNNQGVLVIKCRFSQTIKPEYLKQLQSLREN